MPFTFLQGGQPGSVEDARLRFKIQALSDIYKAMQARLDGYRQSAGAVFLTVVAAALTFDSAFVRIFFDLPTLTALRQPQNLTLASWAIIGAGSIIVAVCIASLWILNQISGYFAEMTSIIYKIDEANEVWELGAWLQGQKLYPVNFKVDPAIPHCSVARSHNETLIGWHDPAIRHFRLLTTMLLMAHLVFYGVMLIIIRF